MLQPKKVCGLTLLLAFYHFHFFMIMSHKFLSGLTAGVMAFSASSALAMSMETTSVTSPTETTMMKKDEAKMTRQQKRKDMIMKRKAAMQAKKEAMMQKKTDAMMKKDTMMEKKEAIKMSGTYIDATSTLLADSVLNDGKMKVLFFHASWCPGCKATDAKITSMYTNGTKALATYKINYDTESMLKQKYGITMQDTLVKVDGTGTMISKVAAPKEADLKSLIGM